MLRNNPKLTLNVTVLTKVNFLPAVMVEDMLRGT